jgi:hypothetical protein
LTDLEHKRRDESELHDETSRREALTLAVVKWEAMTKANRKLSRFATQT